MNLFASLVSENTHTRTHTHTLYETSSSISSYRSSGVWQTPNGAKLSVVDFRVNRHLLLSSVHLRKFQELFITPSISSSKLLRKFRWNFTLVKITTIWRAIFILAAPVLHMTSKWSSIRFLKNNLSKEKENTYTAVFVSPVSLSKIRNFHLHQYNYWNTKLKFTS
jgi:hypothetical protein